MNWVDIIILIVLGSAVLNGFRQGFVVQAATLLGAVVALSVAKLEYLDLRDILASFAARSRWLTAISYLIVFVVVWVAIVLVARRIRWLMRILLLGWADRLAGALLGFLQGGVVAALLLHLGKRVPNAELHRSIRHSLLGPTFSHFAPIIDNLFPHLPK